ncbi:MAG: sigma-54-dependent Fis family transcriptional regulator [Nitrospiraceae bacterium]|nr:MAG: sigma-54-dependent Fis family transcriptional regulator [Nitrospiraceae bacterium]
MKNNNYKLLVVDDERDICKALEFLLSREGYSVVTAYSGKDALEKIEKEAFDLVITDLKMEGIDGMQVLEKALGKNPNLLIIIMTAFASVESAVEAMKKGASDYIVKPFINEDVKMTIRRLLEHKKVMNENLALRQQLSQQFGSKEFVGTSNQIMYVFEVLEKVIPTRSNILILGESGTGKGLVAEIVHCNSQRKDRPFISINCSAIPENLLESELFGYRKGAFTGAASDKKGLIVLADEGTLFLDEIGDMPLSLQSKVLKVLESGEVLPIGGTSQTYVDVRVIAATNKNLEELIAKGLFREDLYYRLNVIEVKIPSLRERREDIDVLAQHFLEKCCKENNKNITGISDEAMEVLHNYSWPGNIRELRNVLERAVVLATSEKIELKELPDKLLVMKEVEGDLLKNKIDSYEKKVIVDTLEAHNWNKEEAARMLGVDLATLYRKIKKLGIIES